MDDIPVYAIDDLTKKMRKYTAIKDYEQLFIIFASTIDALTDAINDTNFDVCEERLIEIYNKLIIYARISYRKCSIELKEKYNIWLKKYDDNNYYNDVYLEDVLLSIK